MKVVGIVTMLVVIFAGVAVSYLVYKQLDTKMVDLPAAITLERTGDGGRCGDVDFIVGARTMGLWPLRVEKGQTISGVVTVDGREDLDVGLRIKSPSNRLVFREVKRLHRQEFEMTGTIRGEYLFEFDNRHSALTEKHIMVSVCVT